MGDVATILELAVFAIGQMTVFFVFLARLASRVAVLENSMSGIEKWVEKVEERQWEKEL